MKLSEAIAALESGQIVRAGQRVLCALSGGADSVALAHILRSAADAAGYEVCGSLRCASMCRRLRKTRARA